MNIVILVGFLAVLASIVEGWESITAQSMNDTTNMTVGLNMTNMTTLENITNQSTPLMSNELLMNSS